MPAPSSSTWDRRSVLRTAEGGGGSGKSLVQYFHAYGEAGTQEAIKRYARAYDGARVTTQWITGTNFESKLFSALLTDNAPDVFEFHPQLQLIRSGQVAPLDDIIDPVKADFNPADIASHTVDGKVYGVRMIDDPQFFYYRRSLLEKAGLGVPRSLDELAEAAAALTTDKVKGLFIGNSMVSTNYALVWAAGADQLDDRNRIAYHTDDVAAALKVYRRMFTSGHLLLDAPADYWDPSALVQGLTAIQWCGMWAMPVMQKALGDDLGIFPFPPAAPGAKPAVYNGGWSMFVNAKGDDVDLAKEYVKWLWIDRKEYQEDWALGYGFHIPPRTSIAESATKLKSGLPAEAVKLFTDYGRFDNISWTQAMITAFEEAVADAVRKGTDPEKALDAADEKVGRELDKLFA